MNDLLGKRYHLKQLQSPAFQPMLGQERDVFCSVFLFFLFFWVPSLKLIYTPLYIFIYYTHYTLIVFGFGMAF